MARAIQRTAARRDFIIHYAYLLEHAGLDTAKRFREAVERTYAEFAGMPEMGAPGKIKRGNTPVFAFGLFEVSPTISLSIIRTAKAQRLRATACLKSNTYCLARHLHSKQA